jgi:putative oxidoreductase
MNTPVNLIDMTGDHAAFARPGPVALYGRATALLDAVPWSLLALVMRVAAFVVFWRSGMVKLADWDGTLALFADEYRVPLLPPVIAAYMATTVEVGGSVLILLGLGTRFAALAFLGMVAVIQTFVYPQAWPDHVQWLGFLLPLLVRGGGSLSLDHLTLHHLVRRLPARR